MQFLHSGVSLVAVKEGSFSVVVMKIAVCTVTLLSHCNVGYVSTRVSRNLQLNGLGLLPTHLSDWISSLPPRPVRNTGAEA